MCALLPAIVWGADPVEVEADHMEKIQNLIEASGNVVVKGQDLDLTCNYLFLDMESGDIWATGDCILKDPKGEIKASHIQYNRRRQDAHVENGSILLYAEPLIISGSSITRYGNDLYIGNDLTYTPCLSETPAWSIKTERLQIPLEGYGQAKDARFQVKDTPVAYIPYLLFPAKLKRQSGLLLPSIGSSSDTGFSYGQPVYVTLGRSADVTFTPTLLARRGLLGAAEFRYVRDFNRQGLVYAEFLHDRLAGELLNEDDPSSARPDNRWYLKASHTGGDLTWDVNLVSNRDYFRDIGPFYTIEKQGTWIEQLQERTEDQISRLQYVTTTGPVFWNLSSQWKQDLTIDDINNNLQELPRLDARLTQQSLPHTPFMYTARLSTVRLFSPDDGVAELKAKPFSASGALPRGTVKEALKDYADVELSLPVSMSPYLTLRPWIQELYRDTHLLKEDGFDSRFSAEHWEVRGVSLNTSLYSPRFYHDWYHQLVPGVSWSTKTRYNGNYDLTDVSDFYPQLLTDDDWIKTNDITLSLANYIRESDGKPSVEFSLDRSYSRLTNEWAPFEATLRASPASWLTLEHTHTFGRRLDPITKLPVDAFASQEHHTSISLHSSRGDELYLSEEYDRADTQTTYGRTKIELVGGFELLAEARYDFVKRQFEFIRQGIGYSAQCWGVTLRYDIEPAWEDKLEPEDNRDRKTTLGLTVTLLGLGDMRTSHRMSD